MEATLNVRMDKAAKRRGDAVLKRSGLSASKAVRALWDEMAHTGKVPEFVASRAEGIESRERKVAALRALSSSPKTAYSHMSDEELAEIYGSRYE